MKELKNILHRSFRKVRVGQAKQNNDNVEKMKLKSNLDNLEVEVKRGNVSNEDLKKKHELESKIEQVEAELAEATAEKHSKIISEHFEELTDSDGEFSVLKM